MNEKEITENAALSWLLKRIKEEKDEHDNTDDRSDA